MLQSVTIDLLLLLPLLSRMHERFTGLLATFCTSFHLHVSICASSHPCVFSHHYHWIQVLTMGLLFYGLNYIFHLILWTLSHMSICHFFRLLTHLCIPLFYYFIADILLSGWVSGSPGCFLLYFPDNVVMNVFIDGMVKVLICCLIKCWFCVSMWSPIFWLELSPWAAVIPFCILTLWLQKPHS